jgi:hypothetical protein
MQEQCCICLQDFQDEIFTNSNNFLEINQHTQHIKYQLPCLCQGSIYHYSCLHSFISQNYYHISCCYCRKSIPSIDKKYICPLLFAQEMAEENIDYRTTYKRLTFKLIIASMILNGVLLAYYYVESKSFNGFIPILNMAMILFHFRLLFWLYFEETHHEVFNMKLGLNSLTVLSLLFIEDRFHLLMSFLFICIYPVVILFQKYSFYSPPIES